MHCPFCNVPDTKVIDSRLGENNQVRRRRECVACAERFTTYENVELNLPRVIKRDGTRTGFDTEKVHMGLLKALEKRPVTTEQVNAALNHIIHRVQTTGDREIHSGRIGEFVMDELRNVDQVAYVRFASVYRSFQDVSEFHKEIEKLKEEQGQYE